MKKEKMSFYRSKMESIKYFAYFVLLVASVIVAYSFKETEEIDILTRIIKFSTILFLGISVILLIWFLKNWWHIHVSFDFHLGLKAREKHGGDWKKLKREDFENSFILATERVKVDPMPVLTASIIFLILSILLLIVYFFLQTF